MNLCKAASNDFDCTVPQSQLLGYPKDLVTRHFPDYAPPDTAATTTTATTTTPEGVQPSPSKGDGEEDEDEEDDDEDDEEQVSAISEANAQTQLRLLHLASLFAPLVDSSWRPPSKCP